MSFVNSSVKSRAHFNLNDLNPIDHVSEAFIPALFAHAEGDDFIEPHHSQELHEKYAGEKNIILFEGDHNSAWPEFFYNSVCIFFRNCMLIDQLIKSDKVPKERPELPEFVESLNNNLYDEDDEIQKAI